LFEAVPGAPNPQSGNLSTAADIFTVFKTGGFARAKLHVHIRADGVWQSGSLLQCRITQ